jgi:hypothetical protein
MGMTGKTICPTSPNGIVTTLGLSTDDDRIIPAGLVPSELLYDLRFFGTDAAPEVSFKVDNPFDFKVNMMVQYHNRPTGSINGALDPNCIGRVNEPACDPTSPAIKAGCRRGHEGVPFALVSVFFVSENPLFGNGGSGIQPYKCCPTPAGDLDKPMIEYRFKILCGCPNVARQLREPSFMEDL